jgi:hypothetical protein
VHCTLIAFGESAGPPPDSSSPPKSSNEFLKEHRKVQELLANAARLQKQIDALTAGLQE